ncbi:transposase, partial [Nocardiopsis protaetiae]
RDWVRVVFLPRYAPELNPVETLWAHLKRVLRSRLFRSLEDLEQVINAHLRLVRKRTDLLRGFIESVGLEPSPFPSTA